MNLPKIVTTDQIGHRNGRHKPSEYGAVLANALSVLEIGQTARIKVEILTQRQVSDWVRNLHMARPRYLEHLWDRRFRTCYFEGLTFVVRVK